MPKHPASTCAACAAVVLLMITGCTGGGGGAAGGDLSGQAIEVAAVWSDQEQVAFEKVLDAFERKTGASVTYTSAGDELPTVLATRLAGGAPPDVAVIAQPNLVKTLAKEGALVPLSQEAVRLVEADFAPSWRDLGTYDGKLYGVVFKAANKSIMWYDADSVGPDFRPPLQWDDFVDTLRNRADVGETPLAVGGADGWTLTDWFENVYLQTAGPQMYDDLAAHRIPWTHPSVRTALLRLNEVFRPEFIPGGIASALQTEFTGSVVKVFGDRPSAAFVYEADFVAAAINKSTSAVVGEDAKLFPFPQIGDQDSVVGGGDTAVAFSNKPAASALVEFLASAEAASVWVEQGGFISPNEQVQLADYPDEISRSIAEELKGARTLRFDMSDLMPTALGGTKGDGIWKAMQDHLADPAAVDATLAALEAKAATVYRAG
ncbi:ABC transporter substrate-binding protein [Actinomycetes bacterium KLBMP 9759]